jgi:hypothetical protein
MQVARVRCDASGLKLDGPDYKDYLCEYEAPLLSCMWTQEVAQIRHVHGTALTVEPMSCSSALLHCLSNFLPRP